jgi:hypothetical protein
VTSVNTICDVFLVAVINFRPVTYYPNGKISKQETLAASSPRLPTFSSVHRYSNLLRTFWATGNAGHFDSQDIPFDSRSVHRLS